MELTPLLLKKIVDTASQAAILAGKKAVEELTNVTSSLKNPTEVVTEADPLCQDIIIQYIRNVFPTHGILAEEGPNAGRRRYLDFYSSCIHVFQKLPQSFPCLLIIDAHIASARAHRGRK